MATVFLPALLREREAETTAHLRDLLALPVHQAGLGIPNPAKKAAYGYRASIACKMTLTESLLDRSNLDMVTYNSSITEAWTLLGLAELQQMLYNAEEPPVISRRMKRVKVFGGWLNTLP